MAFENLHNVIKPACMKIVLSIISVVALRSVDWTCKLIAANNIIAKITYVHFLSGYLVVIEITREVQIKVCLLVDHHYFYDVLDDYDLGIGIFVCYIK